MALYLGNKGKVKIVLGGIVHYPILHSAKPITNGIRLLSSDNYTLKDSKGLYLTITNDVSTNGIRLLSSDDYTLKDSKGLYLTVTNDTRLLSLDNYTLKDSKELYLTVKESK